MSRILITGIAGFVGRHLSIHALSKGHQVFGLDSSSESGLSMAADRSIVSVVDICDQDSVSAVIKTVRPDVVFHLAGVLKSADISRFYVVNVLGTIALLEAISKECKDTRVIIASSSAVYGTTQSGRPLTEQCKPRPVTHYAASKVAQENVALQYYFGANMPIICVRSFNLIGPGQPTAFAISGFAHQIASAEQLSRPTTILTGNLNTTRDFLDVRDAVAAYELLAESGKPGHIYNVCAERAVSVRQCLDYLVAMSQLEIITAIDPSRVQPHDVRSQLGSAKKLREQTHWKPEIPLTQSLSDMLDEWRYRVQNYSGVEK
jgi:GDP-4-dehydro-6-deoxy-D-mannose reductase